MKNDLSSMNHWFPRLHLAGIPMPVTRMVHMNEGAQRDARKVFDGRIESGDLDRFVRQLSIATDLQGYPCFLRTAHTSAKHDWKKSCYLEGPKNLKGHILAIVEYSELAALIGMPYDWWAVREFLPTLPLSICRLFEDMPVCREFRVFIKDGAMQCWHPYWPKGALEQGGCLDVEGTYAQLIECDATHVITLADRVAKILPGYWSVDLLETKRGWYVTDMAEGDKSFHWEGCAHAPLAR